MRTSTRGKGGGIGVVDGQVKGLITGQGKNLGGGNGVVAGEDLKFRLGLLTTGLPGVLDRVGGDILDGKVTDLEDGRKDGALDGREEEREG